MLCPQSVHLALSPFSQSPLSVQWTLTPGSCTSPCIKPWSYFLLPIMMYFEAVLYVWENHTPWCLKPGGQECKGSCLLVMDATWPLHTSAELYTGLCTFLYKC
ncbi:hypothetical protein I79_022589 [Cricetulus griseus]|uniref:Uncharacterized protein n=1 Tax=Cricetulus griseus TaxID=10029 RepID=G3IFR6_CRIGR|nr:hypothetical protein I79_022589 [Cricetulus griseus]